MDAAGIGKITDRSEFRKWVQPGWSGMLIMTGANNVDLALIKWQCWVPPFALDFLNRLGREQTDCPQAQTQTHHAFHVFNQNQHDRSYRHYQDWSSLGVAIPCIILQLLAPKLPKLHSHCQGQTSTLGRGGCGSSLEVSRCNPKVQNGRMIPTRNPFLVATSGVGCVLIRCEFSAEKYQRFSP